MEQIRRFFAPPVFEDYYENRRANIVNTILLVVIVGSVLLMVASIIDGQRAGVRVLSVTMGTGIGLWLIFKRGNLIIPGYVFPMVILGGITYLMWNGDGLRDEVMLALPIVITLGSFIVGGRSPWFFTLAVMGVITVTGISEINGVLVHDFTYKSDYFDIVLMDILTATVGGLLYILINNLTQSLNFARENEQAALASNKELNAIRQDLEIRVAERTRDLTLSAEIGQAVVQERDLGILLPDAVEQIQKAFALYYAQIYLTDQTGRVLVLRAGSGEVGQELLRRGHRLPIGSSSINGSAAFTQKAVLVEDTAKSESFLPNPLLPKTRSEMAVPLMSGTRVLGVLNMQSEFPDTFTQETLPAYEILAGQLAAAIENAYQFEEIERARAQIEAQSRLLTREGWDNYLDAIRQTEYVGMVFEGGEVHPLDVPVASSPGEGWAAPISVAGAEIGLVHLESEEGTLSAVDRDVVKRLATLAGQHIENLRLLAEAERYRREAEQAARRLTREGWQAIQQSRLEGENGYVYANHRVKALKADETEKPAHIQQTLLVHGEPIGALELALTDEEIAQNAEASELVAVVANALSEHIENLRLAQTTEVALAQTESLYDFTAKLAQADTIEGILKIVSSIQAGSRATFLSITEDEKGQPEWMTFMASCPSPEEPSVVGARYPVMGFPVSNLWLSNPDKPLMFEDVETDRRAADPQFMALNKQQGIRGSIYLPLRALNRWIGLLGITWDTPQTFVEADEQWYEALMAQTATAFNNRLLFTQTTKRAERETLINTINQRIQSATSVEGALETAAREIGHLLKARRAVAEIGSPVQNGQD